MGYDTKADIFSAGIILCAMLTGVCPFYSTNREEVLRKNKEGNVSVTGVHWDSVSRQAKDLVQKMVAKDPRARCTAREALRHPWFAIGRTRLNRLNNAQKNMLKYQDESRFNVSRIKPEFSVITCTPVFCSRFLGKGSPLLIPKSIDKKVLKKQITLQRQNSKEERKHGVVIRSINERYSKPPHIKRELNDSEDFDENDIDERPAKAEETWKGRVRSFVPRNFEHRELPRTPGFTAKKSLTYLKLAATPVPVRRDINGNGRLHNYLQTIAGASRNLGLNRTANPFSNGPDEELHLEEQGYKNVNTATTEGNAVGSTPRFTTKRLWIGKAAGK